MTTPLLMNASSLNNRGENHHEGSINNIQYEHMNSPEFQYWYVWQSRESEQNVNEFAFCSFDFEEIMSRIAIFNLGIQTSLSILPDV